MHKIEGEKNAKRGKERRIYNQREKEIEEICGARCGVYNR